jgi:short-subunit dehydrogenase
LEQKKIEMNNFVWANLILVFVAISFHVLIYPLESLFVKNENMTSANVIVTGSSMGIGRSVAFEFATKGAKNIVVVSRSRSRLEQLKVDIEAQYPNTLVHVIASDLTQEINCISLIEESIVLMGSIDYLVLNHITDSHYGLWFSDKEKKDHSFLKDLFQVNTFSYIWIATAAMDHLIKSNGHIAVVSSLAGHVGTPFTAAYSASKHALHGFFNALRNELRIIGGNNVSITLCAIGATDTEGAAAAKAVLTKIAWDPPEAAAAAIVRGSAMGVRDVYHPHHKVYPMVLVSKLFPGLADYILRVAM